MNDTDLDLAGAVVSRDEAEFEPRLHRLRRSRGVVNLLRIDPNVC